MMEHLTSAMIFQMRATPSNTPKGQKTVCATLFIICNNTIYITTIVVNSYAINCSQEESAITFPCDGEQFKSILAQEH